MVIKTTKDFYLDDFWKTLFPLETSRFLIERGSDHIEEHMARCLDKNEKSICFLPQNRVYGAKPNFHLRRTVKLDPIAEYFIYSTAYRNRALFRKPRATGREHFGYRFSRGVPINPSNSYRGFRGAISEYKGRYILYKLRRGLIFQFYISSRHCIVVF